MTLNKKGMIATTTLALLLTASSAYAAEAVHYVRPGDTLWLLSQRYGTTVNALEKTNSLKTTMIYPGQKLVIPTSAQTNSYIVQKGDSLFLIGKKYGITADQLSKANNLSTTMIYPGQKLIIPQAGGFVPARSGVKTGELIVWSKANKLFTLYTKATITDVDTGSSFQVQRRGGSLHADVQPLTKTDTATMKKIYGGSWSWNRRAIIVSVGGKRLAASMNGMPHGSGAIKDNNFPGHFCIHFQNSQTHGTKQVDPDHQAAVKKAAGI